MSATTTSEPRTMAMVFFALRGFSASSVSTGTALRCAFGFAPGNASAAAALGAGASRRTACGCCCGWAAAARRATASRAARNSSTEA